MARHAVHNIAWFWTPTTGSWNSGIWQTLFYLQFPNSFAFNTTHPPFRVISFTQGLKKNTPCLIKVLFVRTYSNNSYNLSFSISVKYWNLAPGKLSSCTFWCRVTVILDTYSSSMSNVSFMVLGQVQLFCVALSVLWERTLAGWHTLIFSPIFFLWGGLTDRDFSSSSVGELGAGGRRFNDVGVEFISVRLRVLRLTLSLAAV